MTTIDQKVLGKLPVALPPLPEQKKIAEILRDVNEEFVLEEGKGRNWRTLSEV